MVYHLVDVVAVFNIAVQHAADEIDTLIAHSEWNSQIPVHNLVDAVERILLVNNRV